MDRGSNLFQKYVVYLHISHPCMRNPVYVFFSSFVFIVFMSGIVVEFVLMSFSLLQGLMQHHEEIVEYFKTKGVSAIFLFRRNLLRRMVSMLANSYDQNVKLLNGTHKSHVHSPHEVSLSLSLSACS